MPQTINYSDKSDRDLLVELVVQGNSSVQQGEKIIKRLDKLNGSIEKHAERIVKMEGKVDERTIPLWMQSKWKVGGAGTGIIALMTVACRVAERLIGG